MRSFIFLLLLTGHISSGSIDWSAIETPPQFVHDKNADTVYFKVEKSGMSDESAKNTPGNLLEQTIHCYANGNPRPSYRWKKDGKTFLPSMFPEKVVQKPGEGSLVFSRLDESDAGLYQCEAENSNGTAVDRPVRVQETWIRHFKTAEPEVVVVEVGDPYQRNCSPPASNPYARVYWILMGKEPGHFETISSSHISSNEQGTLFFHYVNETDFKSDRYYTCTAENIELKDYKFGNQFSLQITNNKRRSLQQMPPTEQYVNQSSPIALQGNQHKLHCFFSGYPAPKPRWFHNGREISEDSDAAGFRFESYGKTLVFNVTQDKAGKYDCRFATQQDIDRTFNVVVEAAPYWPLGPPPNTNTSEGEKVIFDCTTYGKPTPKVTFYKNGVEIESQKDDRYLIEGTRLTIFDVKKGTYGKGDNAVYQCKSENKHGWLWTNFYLNLLAFKPQLLIDPGKEEVEAVAGKKVTLECKFFASPNAAVKWEAPMISGSKGNQIPADAYGVGKLVFSEVTAAEEGEYECIGTNKYGQATGLITLKVRKPTIVQPFPRVEEVRMAGEEMRLACDATADNQLEVKYEWLVDGKSLPEDRISSGHYKIDDDHSLVISNPTQDDTAKYKCVVSTKLDQVEKEIKIQFKDVPVAVHSAWVQTCDKNSLTAFIKFEHYESIHTIAPIKEFWVQYQIDSETEGSQWRTHPVPSAAHPNDKIDNNLRHTTGDATVSLQPFGKYVFRVIARNSVGDSAARLAKDQCETPAKQPDKNPDEVAAKGTSPENIIVQWKPMSREEWNGADFHYVVKYRPKDEDQRVGDWKEVAVEDPFADRVTVNLDDEKDVKPFQPYEVQVQAVNSEGRTNVVPETVEGRTGEGVPSSIPSGLRVLEKSGTTVTLAWNGVDPQTANGNFTGYKITYWVDEADQDSDDSSEDDEDDEKRKFRWKRSIRVKRQSGIRKTVVFGPSATQGTLTDLKPATLNHAYIQVTNGAHEGSASDTIDFQTDEGVPSPVRSLRAYPMNSKVGGEKGVVVLVWKKPRQTNGKLARYEVEYCKTQNGKLVEKSCPRKQIDADSKEIRITGLENETPYRFILRAHTSAGEGDPNSSDATTLPETTAAGVDPGVPSLVENAIGDKYFNVSFRPAKYDDESRAPVGNTYEVQYKPQDADEWETVKPAAKMNEKEEEVSLNQIKLKPRISLFNGCTIIIGVIIGSGIFVSPKGVLLEAGSAGMSLLIWLLSGVFAMIGAVCYSELGTLIPKSGGDYAYIYEAFGPLPSFLFLWVALVIINPTSLAIIAITCATYALQPFYSCPVPDVVVNLFAGCIIAVLTFINCWDVRMATRTNDFFTITKLIALTLIITCGGYWLSLGHIDNLVMPDVAEGSQTKLSAIAMAFYSGVFSFSGFSYLNFVTEELKNPFRNLPRAIYISIPIVTIVYMLVNIAYFSVLTVDEILDSDAVAITFADKILGTFGSKILMPLFVSFSCVGSLNGILITCSRMFFSGARNSQLPELFAMISIRQLTPIPSLIFLGGTSIVMLFIGNVFQLINYLSFAESLVVFSSVAGLLKLRFTMPENVLNARPIKISLLWPILFFLMCLFLLILPFFHSDPWELIYGVFLVLSGIPIYVLFVYNKYRPGFIQSVWIGFTHFIQKLFYCVPELSSS